MRRSLPRDSRFTPRLSFLVAIVLVAIFSTLGCMAISTHRDRRAETKRSLAEHRSQQIARLQAYADRGVFPRNFVPGSGPVHMFKDALGTRCAVANLIYLDGHGDLVDRAALARNDVIVADETSGPLHDWVLSSGLTNEEVRRVQGVLFGFENEVPALDERERERVRTRLRAALVELITNTDTSLEI